MHCVADLMQHTWCQCLVVKALIDLTISATCEYGITCEAIPDQVYDRVIREALGITGLGQKQQQQYHRQPV